MIPSPTPPWSSSTEEGFDAVATGLYPSITLGNVTYSGIGAALSIGPDFNGSFNTTGGKSLFTDFDLDPDAMRFDFGTAVNAFAFNWGASDNTWTLQAFDAGGGLLDTLLIAATGGSNAGEYFGIAAAGIKWAILTDTKDRITDGDYVFVDRFTTNGAAVPEPSLCFCSDLVSLGWQSIDAVRADSQ